LIWPTSLQAGGLGLVFPGGGFTAVGGSFGYAALIATVALFAIALALWLLTGNLLAPIAVWLGSAYLAAATIGNGPPAANASLIVAGIAAAVAFWRVAAARGARVRQRARLDRRRAYLPAALVEAQRNAAVRPAADSRELSSEQIAALRYAIDRGLQPDDAFDGFDVLDQFQTAALRYQITFLQFALGLAQATYLPNFHGCLSQAQRGLIRKFTQRRVWDYWVYESLFGNFSLDFDPIGRDNIMLGGFYNGNVSLYTANTGDRCFVERGSLPFRLTRRKVWLHDANTLAAAARSNLDASVFCLYPCEPRFAYTYCNLVGLTGIQLNDRIFGTTYAPDIMRRFREHLENEFRAVDGTLMARRCRSRSGALFRSRNGSAAARDRAVASEFPLPGSGCAAGDDHGRRGWPRSARRLTDRAHRDSSLTGLKQSQVQRPCHRGARFSANAFGPSIVSSAFRQAEYAGYSC
jgi:hypothetical protein